MYRNNHDRSSRASRPRAARFFDTFRQFQNPPRRTGKATLGRLVNPPLLVNPTVIPSEDASAAGLATAGQRGRKRKKNYDRHGSRITLGNRPRRTPEVAVVDIGNYFDPRSAAIRIHLAPDPDSEKGSVNGISLARNSSRSNRRRIDDVRNENLERLA